MGEDLLDMEPDERSRAGLFLCFQYPHAVPGVTVANFLRMAINAHRKGGPDGDGRPDPHPGVPQAPAGEHGAARRSTARCPAATSTTGSPAARRSGSRSCRWRCCARSIAILDETDSGLDIDALRIVADGVNRFVGPEMGALVITHYQRILEYVKPDSVHVLVNGRIVRSGGPELAHELERTGYAGVLQEV